MSRYAVVVMLLGIGCASEATREDDALNRCEAAARHIESCTGVYVSPPVCEGAAAGEAEALLGRDCDAVLGSESAAAGKADGALCNWFGAGCATDEKIFTGPACSSAAQCSAGSACLEGRCFAGLGSPEAATMLDTLTGTRARSGNTVTPLITNREAREQWLRLIGEARQSIHAITLLIEDNATGHAVVDALVAAARRGVEVRVVVDSVSEYTYGNYDLLQQLSSAGAQVIAFNPITEWSLVRWEIDLSANQRIHEKVLVVDGKVALTGGRNIGDSYFADDRWRDRDVMVTGAAVADLQRLFLTDWDEFSDWERRAGCPLKSDGVYCRPASAGDLRGNPAYYPAPTAVAGDASVRVLHSNPRKQQKPVGWMAYLALVRSARKSIKITNAYFVPPARLRRHLRAAAARGVKVEVVTNSKTSNDERSMWWAAINHYEELIKGGVSLCEWRGNQTVHVKAMVVDDRVAVVGSYNLDPRSATTNSEVLTLLEGSVVGKLVQAFAEDRTRCDVAGYAFSLYDRTMATTHRIAEPFL